MPANQNTSDINVREIIPLMPPEELKKELPISDASENTVLQSRRTIQNILDKKDERLLAIVGPCSINDTKAALDYAKKLKNLRDKVSDRIELMMRVYFEKPRTTVGWKGLITDPQIDGQDDVANGIYTARDLLLKITAMGLPTGTEFLEPIVPQYLSDVVSWAAIGARTTESQTHRQMASGLSMPVGFKNNTDGNKKVAVDALLSARSPHSFLGIDAEGRTSIVKTRGNPYGHMILRGGGSKTNFEREDVKEAQELLEEKGLEPAIMVDCSHANSNKEYRKQEIAWNSILEQKVEGNRNVIGLMLESNIYEGKQKLPEELTSATFSQLQYGVSITDACIGWDATEELIKHAYTEMGKSEAVLA